MDKFLKTLTYIFAFITFAWLTFIVVYVLVQGIPALKPSLFAWNYTTQNLSMMPAIITTLEVVVLSLLIAVPLGVMTGICLIEYADSDSWWVKLISLVTDTLAGVPSIVYGLFGMLAFVSGVTGLGFQYSLIAGVLTMIIMVLPLIIRNTQEGLLSVPQSQRMASYGLGAGKLRTIVKIVLPSAMPGILSGVILAVGRIVGETAALMYTLGTGTGFPKSLLDGGRTLALHMYILTSEGQHRSEAMATGVVLLIFVLIINAVSTWLSNKLSAVGGND